MPAAARAGEAEARMALPALDVDAARLLLAAIRSSRYDRRCSSCTATGMGGTAGGGTDTWQWGGSEARPARDSSSSGR